MANSGERVMVVAQRDVDPATFDAARSGGNLIGLVTDLTLLAMVGIVDPPRPEDRAAIAECRSAPGGCHTPALATAADQARGRVPPA